MNVYKVEYYTLGKGKNWHNEPGNIKQFCDVAYIQCPNTSHCEVLLEKHYENPRNGYYYHPVITSIRYLKEHCIIID